MKLPRTVLTAVLLSLAFSLPSALWGGDQKSQQPQAAVAQVEIGASRVDWLPKGDYEHLVLTIAGPGDLYLQREFGPGETPVFSALDVPDGSLADGVYAYELRAVPRQDRTLREKLARAREAGEDSAVSELLQGGSLPAGALVQAGHLWVEGGSFVSGQSTPEAKPPLRNVTANATTVPDDLVVQGQACIGPECVAADANGPVLTLKEHGFTGLLQIKFAADNCCLPTEHQWALQANDPVAFSGDFLIRDLTNGRTPVRIGPLAPDNSLTVYPTGNIGLGTSTPGNSLHVLRTNGTAQLLVEEASPTAAFRTLATLKNNGGVQLVMRDTSAFGGAGVDWYLRNINAQLQLIDSGDATKELVLDQSGNLTISGTLTQGSDRYTKREITPVEPAEVLAKVMALPIATWNRKADDPAVRHMGPMAQDFAAIFGLGDDDRQIAVLDMAGVSLASIQALNGRMAELVTEKNAEISELRRENADLAARLAALEALVSGIAESPAKH